LFKSPIKAVFVEKRYLLSFYLTLALLVCPRINAQELPNEADLLPPPPGDVAATPVATQVPTAVPKPSAPQVPTLAPKPPAAPQATPLPVKTTLPKVAAETPAAPHVLLNSYQEGLAFYKKGRFEEAIPWFRDALEEPKRDPMGFYYLGVCQLRLGKKQEALVSLTFYYKLHPSYSLMYYIDGLRAKLTSEEKYWADQQIYTYGEGNHPELPPEENYPMWGIQFKGEVALLNLTEFTADGQAQAYNANVIDGGLDPSYQFNGTIPNASAGFGVEPFARLGRSLEVALPLSYLSLGTVSDKVQSNLFGNSQITYDLSALMGGLDGRILAGQPPLQFFVSAGPRVAQVQVNVTSTNSAGSTAVNFSSLVWGAQAQVGVDWEFFAPLHVCPAVGYRWLDANHLTGNVQTGSGNTLSRLEYNTNSAGSLITTVPDSQTDPAGMSPLDVNLSGPTATLSISALF